MLHCTRISGREGQVHLHRADVGVGPRDQLARLDPVVEGERHPRQVLVDDVAQVELDLVGGLEEEEARDVAGDAADDAEADDPPHVVAERHGVVRRSSCRAPR